MSVFVTAARDLHADPNGSFAVAYRVTGQGPATIIRVTRSTPDDLKAVFGQSIKVGNLVLTVLCEDVAQVRQSDSFTFEGATAGVYDGRVAVALSATLDAEGVSWQVQCRDV